MRDIRTHYHCPAPRCTWTYAEPLFKETVEDYQRTERVLTEHLNTHRLYLYVIRLRVWWAARGDGAHE